LIDSSIDSLKQVWANALENLLHAHAYVPAE
jgi:hypothetical protein